MVVLDLGIGAEPAEAFAAVEEGRNLEEDHSFGVTDSLDQGRSLEEIHSSRERVDLKDDRGDGDAT